MREWSEWMPMATRMPEPDPIVAMVFLEVARSLVGPPEVADEESVALDDGAVEVETAPDAEAPRLFPSRTVSTDDLPRPAARAGEPRD